MTKARDFKLCKPNYQLLISDLQALGYSAQLHTIEIGSLGHYLHHTFSALKAAAPLSKVCDRLHLLTNIAKTAINCSHTIFTQCSSVHVHHGLCLIYDHRIVTTVNFNVYLYCFLVIAALCDFFVVWFFCCCYCLFFFPVFFVYMSVLCCHFLFLCPGLAREVIVPVIT